MCIRVRPKDFALVAYGGAGPMHAIDVAALLGINHVVVPLNPGIASAFGLLASEFKNDYARTFLQQASGYDSVSDTHLRAHETLRYVVCRLLLEK